MRRFVAMLAIAASAIFAFAGPAGAVRSPRLDVTGNIICLTNSSGFCVDIKDDVVQDGQPVWVFSVPGGNGIGWAQTLRIPGVCDGESSCGGSFQPFTDHALDSRYDGDPVNVFAVNNHRGLCLGESGGNPVLRLNCTAPNTLWVKAGNQFINVERTNIVGGVRELTARSNTDEADILLDAPGTAGTWQQWSVRCSPDGC